MSGRMLRRSPLLAYTRCLGVGFPQSAVGPDVHGVAERGTRHLQLQVNLQPEILLEALDSAMLEEKKNRQGL